MSSSLHLIQSACFLAFYHSLRDFPRICVLILYIYFSAGAAKGLYYRYSNHLIFPFNLFPIAATYFGEFSWLLSWFQNIFHFRFRESFANPACIILNEQPEIYFYTLWIWNYIIELQLSIPFTLMVLYKVIGDNGFFYIHSIL